MQVAPEIQLLCCQQQAKCFVVNAFAVVCFPIKFVLVKDHIALQIQKKSTELLKAAQKYILDHQIVHESHLSTNIP